MKKLILLLILLLVGCSGMNQFTSESLAQRDKEMIGIGGGCAVATTSEIMKRKEYNPQLFNKLFDECVKKKLTQKGD